MNQAIAEFCVNAYLFLLSVAWVGVAIVVFVLLPMSLFRATRIFSIQIRRAMGEVNFENRLNSQKVFGFYLLNRTVPAS